MTEQRILVYKLFLSLHIPDFRLIFIQNLHPPEISAPPVSQPPPLRTEVGLLEGGEGVAHYVFILTLLKIHFRRYTLNFQIRKLVGRQ